MHSQVLVEAQRGPEAFTYPPPKLFFGENCAVQQVDVQPEGSSAAAGGGDSSGGGGAGGGGSAKKGGKHRPKPPRHRRPPRLAHGTY